MFSSAPRASREVLVALVFHSIAAKPRVHTFDMTLGNLSPVLSSKPLLGHASPHSFTSRLRVPSDASPTKLIRSSSSSRSSIAADPESWPEYLKIQQNATTAIYESPRYGDIKLRLASPAQPSLGGHYVWDSAIMMSEFISEDADWRVEGKRVLDLGAGTALASIVSVLCGAKEVMACDYPDSRLLESAKFNIAKNVPKGSQGRVSVRQHLWGCVDDKLARENENKFDVIIASGCLFFEDQHVNIARSMAHFLKKDLDATVYIVSGFFLGRQKLETFFQVAFVEGLSVITMFERDALGETRDCYVDCPDTPEEILERGWLLVAQMGWHVADKEDFEEEQVQIEFKNLDNGTVKKARPKSMLVRG
jgi:EEF1A N-terminal glycine/lysine methyltransferase